MSHNIALMELSGIRCKVLKRGHSREVGERQHQQHRGHGSRWVVHQTTIFFFPFLNPVDKESWAIFFPLLINDSQSFQESFALRATVKSRGAQCRFISLEERKWSEIKNKKLNALPACTRRREKRSR